MPQTVEVSAEVSVGLKDAEHLPYGRTDMGDLGDVRLVEPESPGDRPGEPVLESGILDIDPTEDPVKSPECLAELSSHPDCDSPIFFALQQRAEGDRILDQIEDQNSLRHLRMDQARQYLGDRSNGWLVPAEAVEFHLVPQRFVAA